MLEHQSVAELFLETFLMREVDANALKRLLRRTGAKKTENLRFDFISYYAAHSNLFEYFGPADDSLAFDDFLSMIPTRPELQQRIVEIWTNQFAQIDASEQFGWLLTRLYFAPLPIQADLARAIRLDGLPDRERKEEAIHYLRELRYLIGTGTPDEDDLFTEIESRITPGVPHPLV